MTWQEEQCVCNHCAFADCCPSAYFNYPQICADLRDMRNEDNENERTA